MRSNDRQKPAAEVALQRPYASETAIREMHDKAARHRKQAADLEQTAANLVKDAEDATGRWVSDAQAQADSYVKQAQETAAELIRQAHAQADEHVRQAKEQADEGVRQAQEAAAAELAAAGGQAGAIRADRDAEVKSERYWSGLAAEEAEHAGLSSVRETLTDGQLDASGARDA